VKKIIYIMGAGRSGTTLLDIILGNGDNLFSCGELNHYPRVHPPQIQGLPQFEKGFYKHIKTHPEDALDEPRHQFYYQSLQFWQHVLQTLTAKQGGSINFQRLNQLHARYEYHSAFFKKHNHHSKAKQTYNTFIRHLYESIFEHIDADIIVDSSKYPMRALQLAEILPYELNYLYLKRDPVGVVESFEKKQFPNMHKSWLGANQYYLLTNMLCCAIGRQLKKTHPVLEIYYEDLISKPIQTLKFIETQLNIDLTASLTKIRDQQPLEVGYLFCGNPIRKKPYIELQQHLSKRPPTLKNTLTRIINKPIYHSELKN